jgi:hypothetical protein
MSLRPVKAMKTRPVTSQMSPRMAMLMAIRTARVMKLLTKNLKVLWMMKLVNLARVVKLVRAGMRSLMVVQRKLASLRVSPRVKGMREKKRLARSRAASPSMS